MGYINGGGGVVLEVGGHDKGDGKRVCVRVCAWVLCGRWADTKGYKEMRY